MVEFYFGKKEYVPATVQLTNGKTLMGEVQDFDSPNIIEIRDFGFKPSDIGVEGDAGYDPVEFDKTASFLVVGFGYTPSFNGKSSAD